MRALIDQLSAARFFRDGAPFPVVADAPAVAIPPADEHHLAERARFENLPRLTKRAMKAVIESDAHQRARSRRRIRHRIEFGCAPRTRLLDQHVLARGGRFGRNRSQPIVRRRYEDRIDIALPHSLAPVGGSGRAYAEASFAARS